MILFSSDALSDIERVRNFLEIRNPQAAVRAMRAIWAALGPGMTNQESISRIPYQALRISVVAFVPAMNP